MAERVFWPPFRGEFYTISYVWSMVEEVAPPPEPRCPPFKKLFVCVV